MDERKEGLMNGGILEENNNMLDILNAEGQGE
jgi:hypothetical protein